LIKVIDQFPLIGDKGDSFVIRTGCDIDNVIDPAEVCICPEEIIHQIFIDHQTSSEICLDAAGFGY
jgi:hypothetical protein